MFCTFVAFYQSVGTVRLVFFNPVWAGLGKGAVFAFDGGQRGNHLFHHQIPLVREFISALWTLLGTIHQRIPTQVTENVAIEAEVNRRVPNHLQAHWAFQEVGKEVLYARSKFRLRHSWLYGGSFDDTADPIWLLWTVSAM